MNIFFLHEDPTIAAKAQTNKHVIKMIVESAQLLSTAHRVLDGEIFIQMSSNGRKLKRWGHPELNDVLYKSTHINHPSAIWVRESKENYQWLYRHFIALCKEYNKRYDRIHATYTKLAKVLQDVPKNTPAEKMTPIKCAINIKEYIVPESPILSYRNYYIAEKLKETEDKTRFYNVLQLG